MHSAWARASGAVTFAAAGRDQAARPRGTCVRGREPGFGRAKAAPGSGNEGDRRAGCRRRQAPGPSPRGGHRQEGQGRACAHAPGRQGADRQVCGSKGAAGVEMLLRDRQAAAGVEAWPVRRGPARGGRDCWARGHGLHMCRTRGGSLGALSLGPAEPSGMVCSDPPFFIQDPCPPSAMPHLDYARLRRGQRQRRRGTSCDSTTSRCRPSAQNLRRASRKTGCCPVLVKGQMRWRRSLAALPHALRRSCAPRFPSVNP